MAESKKSGTYFFIGFGIVAIISGIFLINQKDYLIGVSGSMVGLLIVYQNILQAKQGEKDQT